jgi:hypothetical protein
VRVEFDPERVVVQVACINYEKGRRLVAAMLDNMAKMVGVEPELETGPAEAMFGWTFYPLSISKLLVRRLAGLPNIDISKMKGGTLDEKFVSWFNGQLSSRAEDVQLRLASDLQSSQFGLF